MGRPKRAPGEELRRGFTLEFKQEAVRRAAIGDQSMTQLAVALGIRVQTLYQWRRQMAGEDPRPAVAGAPREVDEVRRLKRRVRELEEEAVILGKAMAFFAKRHG
jgi:transposase